MRDSQALVVGSAPLSHTLSLMESLDRSEQGLRGPGRNKTGPLFWSRRTDHGFQAVDAFIARDAAGVSDALEERGDNFWRFVHQVPQHRWAVLMCDQ
mmetsp:Transcript_32870/g.101595  ORF Transcript_32870/g.101595 Transcript_32870/m.101595 type:complete len:97 (+) Transcript_32870:75-365(+)